MKIFDFLNKSFKVPDNIAQKARMTKTHHTTIDNDKALMFLEYGLSLCIDKIANALTMTDVLTYEKGEEKKGDIWYKLNVEPNQNQTPYEFWHTLVYRLVYDPLGALIVMGDEGELFIADSFTEIKYATKPNYYNDIQIEDYVFKYGRGEKDVLRLRLNNNKIYMLLNNVYSEYGILLPKAIANYSRKNAIKLLVKIDSTFDILKTKINEDGESEYDMMLQEMFENRLKGHLSDKNSATPVENGLTIEDVSKSSTKTGDDTTRDINKLFEDIINMCADAFHIPRGLLKGDTADVEAMTDNFIAFAINPITEMFKDECNRKLYGKENILKDTKLNIKTDVIKNYDPTKLANAAEALYRIRVVNTNWVRRLLKEEKINETWAEEYVLTKNYEELKGGEKKNEGK